MSRFILRWLGTAGLDLEYEGRHLLVDPYYTRISLWELASGQCRSREDIICRHLPAEIEAQLITHSHFDHLLDAPVIERLTGAPIVGSATSANLSRGRGTRESGVRIVIGGETLEFGPFRVRVYKSRHSRFLFGRVPADGTVDHPITARRAWDYKVGPVFIYRIEAGGISLLVLGSADLLDDQLSEAGADVLCPCVAGHQATPDYIGRVVRLSMPRLLIPIHYDNFFTPFEKGVTELPGAAFRPFVLKAREASPRLRAIRPDFFEPIDLGAALSA